MTNTYLFPLRKDLQVCISSVPINLTMQEVKRIVAFLQSLAVNEIKEGE